MAFKFLNEGQSGNIQQFTPIDTFIDPVSKIRVSNPSNLIDTDFEYGLQPTKWETVELINNTPAFFSKGGDTTIPDITGITTNSGTREITVTTAFPHNLAVGIPLRVAGTKSVTADGSYIINATPTPTSFTYLSRANQPDTISIFDLYSSIITGEFFQGSQISISDAEGITTDGLGPISTLTVKTENKHGFGLNTPFYFLNLNSTISQEFEATNSTALGFDPTNSATAQQFDGSNTLLRTPIDLSNSATTSNFQNFISTTDPANATITLQLNASDSANWAALDFGSPLYYSVSAGGGYFQNNPRGVVFIKNVEGINVANNTATFQVSEIPNGSAIPILANMQGFFQIADQARTFAGNNVNEQTQIELQVEVGQDFVFDGGNQGYDGNPISPPSNTGTVIGYTGTTINLFTEEGILDYYVGAMLKYNSSGTDATGLLSNTTYFVTAFAPGQAAGLYTISIAQLPGESNISVAGGSGTQTFEKIGISLDKDIFHIRDSNFAEGDMLKYVGPNAGSFTYEAQDQQKTYFFVRDVYDAHNYKLDDEVGFIPITATGGDLQTVILDNGVFYRYHQYNNVTTSATFAVSSLSNKEEGNSLEYLIDAGCGGGGNTMGGGGGAGGMITGTLVVTEELTANVSVGGGGGGANTRSVRGVTGGNSSFNGITATGGGGGGSWEPNSGLNGGSGGGTAGSGGSPGTGIAGQGNNGKGVGHGGCGSYNRGGGGGGAGSAAINQNGAPGVSNSITGTALFYAGGGGGGANGCGSSGGSGVGGFGTGNGSRGGNGTNGRGGGGGAGGYAGDGPGGTGGSGTVVIRYQLTDADDLVLASGGAVTGVTEGNFVYAVHTFTSLGNSSFVVEDVPSVSNGEIQYLIVAGGGGGGNTMGGGGGAGGMITGAMSFQEGTYNVTVGSGGSGASNRSVQGADGGPSSFNGITATGGGGGGSWNPNSGRSGGSGGGTAGSGGSPGTGIAGQGNSGKGVGHGGCGSYNRGGGGGGKGAAATSQEGGAGLSSNFNGQTLFYAGGGGGGANGCGSSGGSGVGGNGTGNGSQGGQGMDGRGGGGGAGGYSPDGPGGRGGHGVVILRYAIAEVG